MVSAFRVFFKKYIYFKRDRIFKYKFGFKTTIAATFACEKK
jgi:hypothetical protein